MAGGDLLELPQGHPAVVRGFLLGEVVLASEIQTHPLSPLWGGGDGGRNSVLFTLGSDILKSCQVTRYGFSQPILLVNESEFWVSYERPANPSLEFGEVSPVPPPKVQAFFS